MYIGDGVYASFDGFGVKLSTDREDEGTHWIYLEPEIIDNLLKFIEKHYKVKITKLEESKEDE